MANFLVCLIGTNVECVETCYCWLLKIQKKVLSCEPLCVLLFTRVTKALRRWNSVDEKSYDPSHWEVVKSRTECEPIRKIDQDNNKNSSSNNNKASSDDKKSDCRDQIATTEVYVLIIIAERIFFVDWRSKIDGYRLIYQTHERVWSRDKDLWCCSPSNRWLSIITKCGIGKQKSWEKKKIEVFLFRA